MQGSPLSSSPNDENDEKDLKQTSFLNIYVCVCVLERFKNACHGTFKKSLCQDVHWSGAVHTHHLL